MEPVFLRAVLDSGGECGHFDVKMFWGYFYGGGTPGGVWRARGNFEGSATVCSG